MRPASHFLPTTAAKIVIANTFMGLAKAGADVTLFCFSDEAYTPDQLAYAEQFGKVIMYNHSIRNTPKRMLKAFFSRTPIYLNKYISREMLDFLSDLCEKENFDAIQAEHTCMAPHAYFLRDKFNLPVGLRLHNVEYLIWQRYADVLSWLSPAKTFVLQQSKLLKSKETEIYNQADICFAISEIERQKALKLAPKANVVLSSVGVDFDVWKVNHDIVREPNTLVLATTYKWVHNVDGLDWFLEKVLPKVKSAIPNVKLKLIGKNPPEKYSLMGDNIDVVGYVDDVAPHLNSASVYIAPLFVGAGIRIKILEALAMELPVVATEVSAEGINAGKENGLFVTDNPDTYADYVIALLKDSAKARQLGKNACDYIKENFSWEKNVGIMYDFYKTAISK